MAGCWQSIGVLLLDEPVNGLDPGGIRWIRDLMKSLATLAAGSAIPVELTVTITVRPAPAIETIAYFCAAELLANAAKHSQATKIKIDISERSRLLILDMTDDGLGGADPARGSGLSGLTDRVAVVDGRLGIASPPGGPTQITVELPLRTGTARRPCAS